ncbi:MAG: hypothetical protein ACTH0V_09480 [Microbacteriaceae bacterium]|uniref:hypothetical protein n=1 Tax=Microbacterium sp. JB110 TaxID=2024477 RepID=UPI00097F06ED|nr:hypothetical protein [Microbacterium sp. JB110]RCS63191.1 hypothetical protein CIK77_03140 [Microbacterium sp. JB110]SJM52518.1 hypothetical protein CZ774_05670 [Frigoribacterium sp. JB110]
MTVVRNDTDEAVYEATTDDTLTVREVIMNSVSTLETPAGSSAYDTSEDPLSFTEARYACEGNTLSITTEGGAVAFGREH